jgi:peptidyl-prolyl cis-trans isomerase D
MLFDMKNKKLSELDTKKFTKNSLTYFVMGLALFAMVFFGVCNPQGGQQGPTGPAGRVGSEDISQREFQRAYSNNVNQYSRQYGEGFDPAAMGLAQITLNQLIDQRLDAEFVDSLGVAVGDDELIEYIGEIQGLKDEQGKFLKENFENWLRSMGHTEATLLEELRRSFMTARARELVASLVYVSSETAKLEYILTQTKRDFEFLKIDSQAVKPEIAEAEVTAYVADANNKAKLEEEYARRRAEFNQVEKRKARHILLSFKGARNAAGVAATREKEAARILAAQALEKVRQPGADFAALASELTDEPAGKNKGGDLGEFGREDMVAEFSDAAFAMTPGAISELVESPFGFHVIKLESVVPAKSIAMEAVAPELGRSLLKKDRASGEITRVAGEILQNMKDGTDPAPLLTKYNLAWAATGPVALDARYIPGLGSQEPLVQAVLGLNQTNNLVKEAIVVGDVQYLVRFKSETKASSEKMSAEEMEQYQQMLAYTRGSSVYNSLSEAFRKSFEDRGRIWRNDDYLALEKATTSKGG